MSGVKDLLKEARRRRVFRTAGIYIVAAWVAVQVFSEVFPAFDIAAGAIRYVWLGALIGLPLAVIFGWLYDLTSEGIVRTAPSVAGADADLRLRKADYVVLAALAIAASTAVYQLSDRIAQQEIAGEPSVLAVDEPIAIAVLPLENASGDPDQAFFVNGIHDALISDLSRISGLQITSKTSARAYANTTKPAGTICRELAVSNVIEGSVVRNVDTARVSVTLKDCESDKTVWAQSYERELSDVLILQSGITRSIAEAVQVALTREESELLARTRSVNPAAYESYLRGMFRLELFTPQDMQAAEDLFERALTIDANSALAYWGLGRACRFQLQFGQKVPRQVEPECRGHLFKALAIEPDLPQVHLGLAISYWLYDYDWAAADSSFRRALELNPNYAEAYMFYSHFLAHMLRWEESDRSIDRAVELDPLNVFVLGLHAAQQHLLGRIDKSVKDLNSIHDRFPGFGFGFDVLWYSNFKLGNHDASIEAAKKHFTVTVGMADLNDYIDRAYADHGFDGAMRLLGEELERRAEDQFIQGVFIAMPFAMAGDAGKAVEWLQVALGQRDPMMPYIGTLAGISRIENDPRFAEILDIMNLSLPGPAGGP